MNDERAANAVDRKLGQRVRSRRLEIGMSQEKLAELLGVTFQQVQKYEKGVNRIAASRLFDISAALDVPIARFFENIAAVRGGAGVAESRREFVDDALATPEGAQLMALFSSIKNIKVRRRVVELVRALTEEGEGAKRN
ncbi:MAG TPA: helix-turn-helix transcriptional regulator [Terricaulis sp.]|nr:helix-turn-helix transcriptional regulator [Terricaulis sp.]